MVTSVFRHFQRSCCTYFARRTFALNHFFELSAEVQNAKRNGQGIVALESTVVTHGLPYPENLRVAMRLEETVRSEGAIPATIALIDGKIRVGLKLEELERIANSKSKSVKVSLRDVSNVLVERGIGGTTVAATIWIANCAGIKVFATGGIGGVHRGAENSFDISADLTELGRVPVAVVCAGAKSILDIPKTLEVLETNSVNIIAFSAENFFPGFFMPKTRSRVSYHTTSLEKIANILVHGKQLGLQTGTLIACPLPERFAENGEFIERCIETAISESGNISSKDVTPFILRRVNELSGSLSMKLNVCLLENNARIAAKLANLYALNFQQSGSSSVKAPKVSSTKKKGKPKVMCIGASILDMEARASAKILENKGGYYKSKMYAYAGGVARNHADALTRLSCDVKFLSVVGDDIFSKMLLAKCRHMDLSNVVSLKTQRTATSMSANMSGIIRNGFIDVDEIMEHFPQKLVDDCEELFGNVDVVLVDANLGNEILNSIFKAADKYKKPIWFEPTNYLKAPKIFNKNNLWHKMSFTSPNANEFRTFCKQLQFHISDDDIATTASLVKYLSQNKAFQEKIFEGKLNLILISLDKSGCVLIQKSPDGSISILETLPPNIAQEQVISVSGAGDCFNCGFLASWLRGLNNEKCMEVGNLCALESLKSPCAVPEDLERIGQMFFFD